MPTRTARTAWNGGLQDGSGQVELSSSKVGTFDVSFPKRAADDAGGTTSPEELIAAAHSSCYAMQLSANIAEAGGTPHLYNAAFLIGPEATPTEVDALVRQCIAHHGGYVFKTGGDAFCAAFHTAPDALAAALESQRAIHAERWPEAAKLRVRMALHTGAAELRDGDYFGAPLNRAARLLAAGHGGQTLLSESTHDLCRDHLPPLASAKALGEHGLKDLARREAVFQLCHPDLPQSFPPLKTTLAPLDREMPSIAVLPFINMSRDEENEYFADGLSEELLNVLAKIRGLRVASRTSAFFFKGKDIDIPNMPVHGMQISTKAYAGPETCLPGYCL